MGRGLNIVMAAALILALSACAHRDDTSDSYLLSSFARPDPTPGNFFACYGYGCKYKTRIALTEEEWRPVRAIFDPPPANASAERRQVAEAIAEIESLASLRTGASVH